MEDAEEEVLRLHGVVKILEEQIDQERRAYIDETARLNNELHRLNTTLMRIRHNASDFSEVMVIIREYEAYRGS